MKKINRHPIENIAVTNKLAFIKRAWWQVKNYEELMEHKKKDMHILDTSSCSDLAIAPSNNIESENNLESHDSNKVKKEQGPVGYFRNRYQLLTQPGISLKQRIRLIPLVGYGISIIVAFFKLPLLRQQLAINIGAVQAQQEILNQIQFELNVIKQKNIETNKRIDQVVIRVDRYDALDIGKRLMLFDQMQIERQHKSFKLMMRSHQDRENLVNLRIQKLEHQLNLVNTGSVDLTANESFLKDIRGSSSTVEIKEDDSFYTDFEAVFRGKREDIKERLKVYLPYIDNIPNGSEFSKKLVIDIGCGRGEWLELLTERNIPNMGVDLNSKMVDLCIEQGLYARCADAINILKEQEPGSVGAVTGFHIIEHLPFEKLIELFDAALCALCKNGIIIFETPNPENLKVGSCNFYFDPTHLNPIVPQVAEFMAKHSGFAHAEILRLHPYPDEFLLKGDSPLEKLINKEFYGPQDYAVIGRK